MLSSGIQQEDTVHLTLLENRFYSKIILSRGGSGTNLVELRRLAFTDIDQSIAILEADIGLSGIRAGD